MDTVKVVREGGKGFRRINREKYDANPDKYELYEAEGETSKEDDFSREELNEAREIIRKQRALRDAEREVEANRGQVDGRVDREGGRNTSGTYSEPTPTDIRYPNKDATEFENNHGAFVKKSAAQIREAEGLPDEPGGLNPRARHRVEEAAKAAETATKHEGEEAKAEVLAEIPEDWEQKHWKAQVKLAKEISGKDDVNASEAREIIAEEVARREEGAGEGEEGETD